MMRKRCGKIINAIAIVCANYSVLRSTPHFLLVAENDGFVGGMAVSGRSPPPPLGPPARGGIGGRGPRIDFRIQIFKTMYLSAQDCDSDEPDCLKC